MALEILLTILYIILAVVFIIVGVYLILLLHETRKSLSSVNKMIGHVDSIARFFDEKVARPAGSVASITKGVADLVDVIKEFKGGKRKRSDE